MAALLVVGAKEAAAMAGIKPATFGQYLRRRQNGVPQPDAVLACGPIWRTATIQKWVDGRAAAAVEAEAHVTRVERRGSGWGFRCSCGEAPNVSSKRRDIAEHRADIHKLEQGLK